MPLHCTIVTPEQAVYDGPADFVIVPGWDGEVGIWPAHAAYLGALDAGELRLSAAGETRRFFLGGGFVQVQDHAVNVLTDEALPSAGIDAAAVQREYDAVVSESAHGDAAERRAARLRHLRRKLAVAARAGGTGA